MAVLTIRNVPDHVHRALKVRAAHNGRSTEAEVRELIEASVAPPRNDTPLGDSIAELFRDVALDDEEYAAFEDAIRRTDMPAPADLA